MLLDYSTYRASNPQIHLLNTASLLSSVLKENEIFVFGSNIKGAHLGGAARAAYNKFGAEWGNGEGLQGNSYALPTMEGLESTKKPSSISRNAPKNIRNWFSLSRLSVVVLLATHQRRLHLYSGMRRNSRMYIFPSVFGKT